MSTKDKILKVALELFAAQGVKATSLSQIAKKVGIKKPSIYNHFKSKDEIVTQMYDYYRTEAVKKNPLKISEVETLIEELSAKEVLSKIVNSYELLNADKTYRLFWKFIHSEKFHDANAYEIVCRETELVFKTTKLVFGTLAAKGKITGENIHGRAVAFTYGLRSLFIEKLMHNSAGNKSVMIDLRIEQLIDFAII